MAISEERRKMIDEAEFRFAMFKDEALSGNEQEARNWLGGVESQVDGLVSEYGVHDPEGDNTHGE